MDAKFYQYVVPGVRNASSANEGLDYLKEGCKFDAGKLRLDLIPPEVLYALGAVLSHGAQKYEPRNWEKGIHFSRVYAACLRHLLAFWDGIYTDPDSGLPHLWHALCNLVFLTYYDYYYRKYQPYDDSRGADNGREPPDYWGLLAEKFNFVREAGSDENEKGTEK